MSPWRLPMARFDRTLAKSEALQRDLIKAVDRLDRLVAALNVESERIEHEQQAKGEDDA